MPGVADRPCRGAGSTPTAANGGRGGAVPARLDSCGEDLAGLRNRALLLLIQVGGLTPAEGAGLDREDLRFGDGELVLSVRVAKAPVE